MRTILGLSFWKTIGLFRRKHMESVSQNRMHSIQICLIGTPGVDYIISLITPAATLQLST